MVNIERVVRVLSERMCDKTPCIECAGFDKCVRKDGKANGLIKWFHETDEKEECNNEPDTIS